MFGTPLANRPWWLMLSESFRPLLEISRDGSRSAPRGSYFRISSSPHFLFLPYYIPFPPPYSLFLPHPIPYFFLTTFRISSLLYSLFCSPNSVILLYHIPYFVPTIFIISSSPNSVFLLYHIPYFVNTIFLISSELHSLFLPHHIPYKVLLFPHFFLTTFLIKY